MPARAVRRREHPAWQNRLIRSLAVADLAAVVLAIVVAWAIRASSTNENLVAFGIEFSYLSVGIATVPVWLAALGLAGAYDRTVIGSSPLAYTRVLRVVGILFALVCAAAFIGQVPMSRAIVALFFPLVAILDVALRRLVRRRLHRRRAAGLDLHRLVLVGDRRTISNHTIHLGRATHAGYQVIGAYLVGANHHDAALDVEVPVLGEPDDLARDLATLDIDAVAISGSDLFTDESVRSIAWKLHDTGIRLLMAPDLAEIAGPRIVSRPAAGLPMLLVEEPRTAGVAQTIKNLAERIAALIGLVLLSPLLAILALAVKLSSPGPVLFRQTRVARNERPFHMLKFRSMIQDAEAHLDALAEENDHDGVLFKVRDDPRVTRIGRIMRRYSLDELPQLWNVVRGDMAIVGPRPPLPTEVARYHGDVGRRLMVRPGITGLWQVSGRSDLSWDDTVRLDLYYVENWSISLDMIILAKTAKAVLGGAGAY